MKRRCAKRPVSIILANNGIRALSEIRQIIDDRAADYRFEIFFVSENAKCLPMYLVNGDDTEETV